MNLLPTIEPNNSAVTFLIVVVCLGVGAVIILLGRYFNLWQGRHLTNFKFSSKKFAELANAAELSDEEKVFLEDYFRRTKISRFLKIFHDYQFGQSIMRQIYRNTYTCEEDFLCDAELARSYVFSMTQKLENFLHKHIFASSTQKIPDGSRFYLHVTPSDLGRDESSKLRFIGKLRSNHRNYFEAQLLDGNPSAVSKGSNVTIELIKNGDRAIYNSKVRGYANHHKRKKLLIMEHSKKPQIILGARRYNRKQLQTAATIVPLRKEGYAFKADGVAVNALLCDVSMTGCGILSHVRLPQNSYLGVSYLNPYNNETIKFICEIMGYTKLRNTEVDAVILQNRIEKIDYHDRNLISAFVYDFENENDKIKKMLEQQNDTSSTFDENTVAILRRRS